MKGPETDQKREHKAKPQNWETETYVTLLFHRADILLFMCIIIIIIHYFTTFILLVICISLTYV